MNQSKFTQELEKINISVNNTQMEQLHQYYKLLVSWNEKMNLTGITEEDQVYLKHFYDSATLNKIIDLSTVDSLCDVGTGAGFPGLVLKILFPNLKVTLVDSLNKRILFLEEVIKTLGLKDIETVHARAEEFALKHRDHFDVVTARAVAPLNILLEYSLPMVKQNGYFIPMKSKISQEIKLSEHALSILGGKIVDLQEFILPIEESHRSLLMVKKVKDTPKKYPRKYTEIKKRGL